MVSDFTIDYEEAMTDTARFCQLLQDFGVVVVENVLPTERCDSVMNGIVSSFEQLGTGITREKAETWTDFYTPPQTRPGMFQALMSHLPEVWSVRVEPRISTLFRILYEHFRQGEVGPLIPSIDGINIRPNALLNQKIRNKDWPHLDQTERKIVPYLDDAECPDDTGAEDDSRDLPLKEDATFRCIQGQMVLTQTTAAFRCSPKSHLVHSDLLDIVVDQGGATEGNWCKFNTKDLTLMARLQAKVEAIGGVWQIPVPVKKGSFIFWLSTTVHSAKPIDHVEKTEHPFHGWRGVVYVSYRPRSEYTKAQLQKIRRYILENRVMNHWNSKVFSKTPGGRYQSLIPRHEEMKKLIADPTLVFQKLNIDPSLYLKYVE